MKFNENNAELINNVDGILFSVHDLLDRWQVILK